MKKNNQGEPLSKKVKVNALTNQSSQKFEKLLDNWDRFDFRVLDVEKIYKTRSVEIQQVLGAIAGRRGPTRIFQNLPRHLRRRGMSHNCYLFSSRQVRARSSNEIIISGIQPKKGARSFRCYKRRISRLSSQDHNKRQQDKLWLETHIWHAKRFHMMNIWGYRLAVTPTNKGRRASFRAVRDHAVVHDASYHSLIELTGIQSNIITLLKSISNDSPLCQQKHTLMGDKYFRMMTYAENILLGPIDLLWKTVDEKENNNAHQLWMWVHPSIYTQFLELIKTHISALNLKEEIQMENLRKDMFRFELLGPKCNAIIEKLLCIADKNEEFKKEFLSPEIKPSMLPPNVVFSLPITDPRYHRRLEMLKRQNGSSTPKTFQTNNAFACIPQFLLSWDPKWAISPLWEKEKKEEVACHVTEKEFCTFLPLEKLVKPTVCNLIFMRTSSGSPNDSFGCGWTIIGALSWAKPLWRSLIMSGARAIGLLEKREISFNSFSLHFPHDYPETFAGQVEAHRQKEILQKEFNAKPKSKKSNYQKLGVEQPFLIKWDSLFAIPETNVNFLRSKSSFLKLQQQFSNNPLQRLPEFDNTLVCVWLSLVNKGTLLTAMSRIFIAPLPLPKTDNIKKVENQKLIGYLNTGGYDHRTGVCKGVGYVKLEDVIGLQLDKYGAYPVLVKNVDSQWVHQASLNITFYEP
jgi:ribonuclease P/MRP protein subunit POP1